jgi:phosphoribosylformimino-5-aminoimidazole carboxamide ribotide isomerase
VARDGVNAGVNIASAVELQKATGLQVVASGGVNSLDDVQHVHQAGLAGVIIGRALYENRMAIAECKIALGD